MLFKRPDNFGGLQVPDGNMAVVVTAGQDVLLIRAPADITDLALAHQLVRRELDLCRILQEAIKMEDFYLLRHSCHDKSVPSVVKFQAKNGNGKCSG